MAYTVRVLVNVKMGALSPEAAEDTGTEKQDHDGDRDFEHCFRPR